MSLTAIDGVYTNGMACGIKSSGALDLSYIYVPDACASACVLTTNKVTAAPVDVTRKWLQRGAFKAVIINSGNANALTGDQGLSDAKLMQKKTAELLGLSLREVAVASTGIIAKSLPMDCVLSGIDHLLSEPLVSDASKTEKAILTTDLVSKSTIKTKKIGKKTITVAGITKGSGMIAPNMATMLGFLATNVAISSQQLQPIFTDVVADTFNMISVDSDMSTNDMCLIFSRPQYQISLADKSQLNAFKELLREACQDLALQIVSDGEGATKRIDVTVSEAASYQQAKQIAKSIINSPLVKTAIHGCDPNWGRILAAAGMPDGIKLNQKKVTLTLAGEPLIQNGVLCDFDRDQLRQTMTQLSVIPIQLSLALGHAQATAWGCDLSKAYIDINVAYS